MRRFVGDTTDRKAAKSRVATGTTFAGSAGGVVTALGTRLAQRTELSKRPGQAGAMTNTAAEHQYKDQRSKTQGWSSQTQIFKETLAAFC